MKKCIYVSSINGGVSPHLLHPMCKTHERCACECKGEQDIDINFKQAVKRVLKRHEGALRKLASK